MNRCVTLIAILTFAGLATPVRVSPQMQPEAPGVPAVPPVEEEPDAPREVLPAPKAPDEIAVPAPDVGDKMAVPAPKVNDKTKNLPPKEPAMGLGGTPTIPRNERRKVTPGVPAH